MLDIPSEIGIANQIPLTPQNGGSMMSKGMRKRSCLVSDRNILLCACPIL